MTLDPAAQAAADREGEFKRKESARDLYVRAFRAGAQWQQQYEIDLTTYVRHTRTCRVERISLLGPCTCGLDELMKKHGEDACVEPLITSPRPSTGSSVSDQEVK
jgi:hypothetical protein